MHRKLALFILYSLLLLASGYIAGRSTAAPRELPGASGTLPANARPAGDEPASTRELTDWPDLTP